VSKSKLPGVRAWAWMIDGGLCRWAMPDRIRLEQDGKPSPEAHPMLVRLIPESEVRRLVKAAKAAGGE